MHKEKIIAHTRILQHLLVIGLAGVIYDHLSEHDLELPL
jgi:hypothetical protein